LRWYQAPMKLKITKFELSFSPQTRTLMGEWLTHNAFSLHREMYNDSTGQNLSIREFFELGAFDRDLGSMFNMQDSIGSKAEKYEIYTAGLLLEHGIVGGSKREESRYDYKPIVSYDEVIQTFLKYLDPINNPISPYFAYFHYAKTNSENDPFVFDEGCGALIESLMDDDFILCSNQKYFWTQKIRPLFEYLHIWQPLAIIRREQDEQARFNQAIETCLKEEGQIAAMKMALSHPDIDLADRITPENAEVFLKMMDFSSFRDGKLEVRQETFRLRWYGET